MTSTLIAVARGISIAGHPVVLMFVAGLVAASARAASPAQLRLIGGALVASGLIVMGFSWFQVQSGRWAHVDASARQERSSLNVFLAILLFLGAALAWFLTRRTFLSVPLALSGALIVAALLSARWVKISLHAAFAAFATALLWPVKAAFVAGILVTAAVAWSRLVLCRHVLADVIAGVIAGAIAGCAYLAGAG